LRGCESITGEGGRERERKSEVPIIPALSLPMVRRLTRKDQLVRAGRRWYSTPYGGASPSATHARHGKGKDEMACEMSILPLSTGRTTSMPPRLSPRPSTLHHIQNVECSLTIGPCTTQAHLSVRLASLAHVKEENGRRTNGQDEAGHLNPTVRITCCLRWPQSLGCLAAIF
jgi:hypothetical protein